MSLDNDRSALLEVVPENGSTKHEFEASRPKTLTQSSGRSREEIAVSWIQALGTLLVTLVLGFLTHSQTADAEKARKQQGDLTTDNQQHEILSGYIKELTELMVNKELMTSLPNSEVRLAARAITMNASNRLDDTRKGHLLKLLYESRLIGGHCQLAPKTGAPSKCVPSILDLKDTNLQKAKIEGDFTLVLPGIDLTGAFLPEAELPKILLSGAILKDSDLKGANLSGALLSGANMERAVLASADLSNAILPRAVLKNANLRGADLTGADLTGAVLQGADLTGALYDSKTKLPGFNPISAGMSESDSISAAEIVTTHPSEPQAD